MKRTTTAALGLFLVAACCFAAEPDSLPDPRDSALAPSQRLEALLDRMRFEHERLATLEADFVQHKHSVMLLEPSRSSGVFSYAAPNKVRWEYLNPNPISLLITDDEMMIWYRDLQRAEKAGVGKQSQRILEYMGASASMDKLLRYFSVSLRMPEDASAPSVLRLSPLYERVAKRIQELETWIDSKSYLPLRLRYVEGDGDVTEYEFSNLRINEVLPEGRFVLDIPDSVQVRAVQFDPPGRGR
jgi:outer membrane lipoprotein carrier protein